MYIIITFLQGNYICCYYIQKSYEKNYKIHNYNYIYYYNIYVIL